MNAVSFFVSGALGFAFGGRFEAAVSAAFFYLSYSVRHYTSWILYMSILHPLLWGLDTYLYICRRERNLLCICGPCN